MNKALDTYRKLIEKNKDNPTLQQQKFDPKFDYIKKWVPEFGTIAYPEPIIEHTFARDRVIIRYKYALNELA